MVALEAITQLTTWSMAAFIFLGFFIPENDAFGNQYKWKLIPIKILFVCLGAMLALFNMGFALAIGINETGLDFTEGILGAAWIVTLLVIVVIVLYFIPYLLMVGVEWAQKLNNSYRRKGRGL